MRSKLTWLLALFLCTGVRAQNIQLERINPRVTVAGNELQMPWFGGLNTPQFHDADLDGDGRSDLLVYDRTGEQFHAARRRPDGTFEHGPGLTRHFPDITRWAIMRDYNQDGTPDLFAHAPRRSGIEVHTGRRDAEGLLHFDKLRFANGDTVLTFPFSNERTSIFVTGIDYPSVADVDFDGDLDVVTFSALGGFVDLYRNLAVERGFGVDTLIYVLDDQCYGGFFESGLNTELDLAPAAGECFDVRAAGGPGQSRHAGSTVLSLDYDGNGLMDIMLGDISFAQLTLGLNHGSRNEAYVDEQDPNWPNDGVPVNIPTFPAAFHLDVDQDGDRDIVCAPTSTLNAADVEVGWLYENTGTDAAPNFTFSTSRFLVDEMIDLGTQANVSTFDYDADGRPDLVIGNNDEYTGTNFLDSRLRLFRNVTEPGGRIAFELVDEDYLGLSQFMNALWAYAPTFGDLDGDGDQDAIVGERSGKMLFLENRGGAGQPANFNTPVFQYFELDAGQFSKPFLSDLDRDGLLDLVVGGFDGRIRFYRNVGTAAAPRFNPDLAAAGNVLQLGRINTNVPGISTGHPTPWVIQHADHTLLVTGNSAGNLEAYRFELNTPLDAVFEVLTEQVAGLSFGSFSNPAFGDFDGDGTLETVVGNERGGVEFFRSNLRTDGTVPTFAAARPAFDFSVFPNPSNGRVLISGWPAGAVADVTVSDLAGRPVFRQSNIGARTQVQWDGRGLPPGVYLVRLTGRLGVATRRVVVR